MSMKPSIKLFLATLIIVLIAALIVLPRMWEKESTAQAQDTPPADATDNRLSVRAEQIQPQDFQNELTATGTIRASEHITLQPEVSGRIVGIYFEEGQQVNEGDLLVKMEDAELQAELEQAESRRNLAEIRERRAAQLLEQNAAAQEQYDVALNELNLVKAELKRIQARIDLTEIRAPFAGRIGLRGVSPGSYISAGTAIAELRQLQPVKIDFSIPEQYQNAVMPGADFSFSREGSNERRQGQVYAIEAGIDYETRTLMLRARAENPNRDLMPGGFIDVSLPLRTVENAIMVPSEAIIPQMDGQSVYVYSGGTAEQLQVELGVRTADRVHVTEGLAPGDTVLTTGMLQLRPGMPVRIVEDQR
ncbi:MAG: efflux RND transporter periplasmic adaptor subunit [Cyclonatronaceae bacterium]